MRKFLFSMTLLASAFLLQSFTVSTPLSEGEMAVKSSKIVWKAYKVTGSHEGTVELKSGALTFDGDKLTGGSFEIDMTTIACTDLKGDSKGKLEGHLKSDDFFGVEKYTSSTLKVTKVTSTGKNAYDVTGDLTIKGITKPIDFQVSVYGKKATANLKVDRTKHDIRYGSGSFFDDLKDNVIYDEFDLVIDLEF